MYEKTGMDKLYKVEAIRSGCYVIAQKRFPGVSEEQLIKLANIQADALIFGKITHNEYDEILTELKEEITDVRN